MRVLVRSLQTTDEASQISSQSSSNSDQEFKTFSEAWNDLPTFDLGQEDLSVYLTVKLISDVDEILHVHPDWMDQNDFDDLLNMTTQDLSASAPENIIQNSCLNKTGKSTEGDSSNSSYSTNYDPKTDDVINVYSKGKQNIKKCTKSLSLQINQMRRITRSFSRAMTTMNIATDEPVAKRTRRHVDTLLESSDQGLTTPSSSEPEQILPVSSPETPDAIELPDKDSKNDKDYEVEEVEEEEEEEEDEEVVEDEEDEVADNEYEGDDEDEEVDDDEEYYEDFEDEGEDEDEDEDEKDA